MMRILLFLLITLNVFSCKDDNFLYDLSNPDEVFMLDEELTEISGLTFIKASELLCVQDEKAFVYTLDLQNGNIKDRFDFGKDNDYEGIAAFKNKIYVLKSSGEIVIVKAHKKSKTYKMKNNKGVDFEGICVDPNQNLLFIACKEHLDKHKNESIRIYGFDLKAKKYFKKPLIKIPKEKVSKNFAPSGIALHPNGNLFVLSSATKQLIILSKEGVLLAVKSLNPFIFNQPEGIAFDADSNMYISNEAGKGASTLLKFEMNQSGII